LVGGALEVLELLYELLDFLQLLKAKTNSKESAAGNRSFAKWLIDAFIIIKFILKTTVDT
jgi:hypothetical protein